MGLLAAMEVAEAVRRCLTPETSLGGHFCSFSIFLPDGLVPTIGRPRPQKQKHSPTRMSWIFQYV
jgi:hypothetical protein